MTSPKAKGTMREHNVRYKLISLGWNCERISHSRGGIVEVAKFMEMVIKTKPKCSPAFLKPLYPHIKPVDLIAWKEGEITSHEIIEFIQDNWIFKPSVLELLELIRNYEEWKQRKLDEKRQLLFIQVTKGEKDITRQEIEELIHLSRLFGAVPVHVYATSKGYVFKNLATEQPLKV